MNERKELRIQLMVAIACIGVFATILGAGLSNNDAPIVALAAVGLTLSVVKESELIRRMEGEGVRPVSISNELRQAVNNADTAFIDEALESKDTRMLETALKRVKALLEVLLSLAKGANA